MKQKYRNWYFGDPENRLVHKTGCSKLKILYPATAKRIKPCPLFKSIEEAERKGYNRCPECLKKT